MPPRVAAAPKPAATPRVTIGPKVGFRSNPKGIATRAVEIKSDDSRPEDPRPIKPAPAESSSAKTRTAENRPTKATAPPLAKATSPTNTDEPSPAKARSAESRTAKATSPTNTTESSPTKTRSAESRPTKATPAPLAKLTSPAVAPEPKPAKIREVEVRSTPSPRPTLAPAIVAIPATKSLPTKTLPAKPDLRTAASGPVSGRYPWKSDIVTTVFWVGEPVGGHNFTPNYASSWDANWAQTYGGFDNPDPAARRNFIPAKFTPRQNPFYCALPYNDVTRGTTKPEARRVIPWFREAFQREGQSVCRNRWVAIRNRSGKVAYAQWSDCGPFRTDHWQYVFGNEKPKPNLNQGAGLDVSPGLRDYLGLESTDHTDWKFVDARDVPSGPWALYGENNTFALKGSRSLKTPVKTNGRTADNSGPVRLREL